MGYIRDIKGTTAGVNMETGHTKGTHKEDLSIHEMEIVFQMRDVGRQLAKRRASCQLQTVWK